MKKITTLIISALCFATTLFAQGNLNIKFKNGYDFNIQRNNIDSIKFDASSGHMLIHQFGSTNADSISIAIIDTLKFNIDSLVLDETPPDSFNIAIENAPDTIVQIEDIILDDGQSAFDFLQNVDPGWLSDAPYNRNLVIIDASFLNSQDQRNLLIARLFDIGKYLVTDANHTHGGAQPNGLAYVYGGKQISIISRPSPPTNPSANTTCPPDPGCNLDTLYGLDCSGMVSLMAKQSGVRVSDGNCTVLSNPTVWNDGLTASSSHNFDKLKYITVPGPIPPSQLINGDIIFLPSATGYDHMGIVLSQSGNSNIKVFESHGKSYLCPANGNPCTQNTAAGRGPRMVNINTGTLFNQLFGSNFLTLRLIAKPMLGASNSTSITNNSALLTSIVTYSGGDSITQRGFCWSTSPNPTTSGNVIAVGMGSGSFSSTLNGLTDSTTYYVRAYAINNAGTAYGTEISFTTMNLAIVSNATCGAPNVHNPSFNYGSVIDQDGNLYKTIVIGSQEWMAENLKVAHYNNGDALPIVTNWSSWSALTSGASCWYNNDSASFDCPYGRLYNWYAATDTRNLCPTNWHVPSNSEWATLVTYLDINANGAVSLTAGGMMKSISTQYWISPNTAADNSSGFSGLPGGWLSSSFGNIGIIGMWWSSTYAQTMVWAPNLVNDNSEVEGGTVPKEIGVSVRCIKD